MIRRTTWLALALWAACLGTTAEAQDAEARATARARFDRGVALFDEGRFDAALAEFQEAYRIAPSYAVLFNLAQVHARLGHAVEAVDAFERYLEEGGARIPAQRRALAERELATQRERIATLVVEVNAPGARQVRAMRRGYLPFSRVVEVGMGAEAELEIALEPDPAATEAQGTLVVHAPRGASVLVDGEPVDAAFGIALPVGDHEMRIEMPDVQPFVQRVSVTAGETAEVAPVLRYTPAARAAREAGAASQQMAGIALAITGGVLLAGGAGVSIWNETRRGELALDERRELIALCHASPAMPPAECFGPVIPAGTQMGMYPEAIDAAQAQFNSDVDTFNGLMGLGYALVGAGAASLLASVVLFVTAPSEEDLATVRVGIGPGSVSLSGRF